MTEGNSPPLDMKEKMLPTLDELLEDWDGVPPEKYDWGKPQGREIL